MMTSRNQHVSDRTEGDALIRHGVDFSGAASGGSGIRIATRFPGEPLTDLRRLDRPGLRRMILDGLAENDGRHHRWLIDAPFGIPLPTLEACGVDLNWEASVAWMASFRDPRDWRRAVRKVSRKEPRRVADRAASTPLASMNLRVFKQTWTAMVELLEPLLRAGVRIEPMAGPFGSSVVVAEGCPASVLKRGRDSARGYKGTGEPPRRRRMEIVAKMRADWGLALDSDVAARCVADEGGDDLDAVLLTLDPWQGPPPAEGLVEGWVW